MIRFIREHHHIHQSHNKIFFYYYRICLRMWYRIRCQLVNCDVVGYWLGMKRYTHRYGVTTTASERVEWRHCHSHWFSLPLQSHDNRNDKATGLGYVGRRRGQITLKFLIYKRYHSKSDSFRSGNPKQIRKITKTVLDYSDTLYHWRQNNKNNNNNSNDVSATNNDISRLNRSNISKQWKYGVTSKW